ncbi:hypothetical protein Tco_1380498 [Tanacetum coccineum]
MVGIHHLSRWLWGAKHQHSKITADPTKSSTKSDTKTRELDQKVSKQHFQRKSKREVDTECDDVLVPLDGGRLSAGLELDVFDWSIGWLEPHGAGFQSHDVDDSFAVLVRCYGREHDAHLQKNTMGNV